MEKTIHEKIENILKDKCRQEYIKNNVKILKTLVGFQRDELLEFVPCLINYDRKEISIYSIENLHKNIGVIKIKGTILDTGQVKQFLTMINLEVASWTEDLDNAHIATFELKNEEE